MKKILTLILYLTLISYITIFIYPVIRINQAIDSQYIGNMAVDTTYDNQAIDSQVIENHSTYTTFVDHARGFHRVYKNENNLDKIVDYQNRTLNISVGDTIFWSNDAVPEVRLTILSKQNLWKNITCGLYLCSDLRWNYKKFGYTFNKSGIYKIYIQQFPRFNQTIIVGPLETLTSGDNTKKLGTKYNSTKLNDTTNEINNANTKQKPISTITPNKNLTVINTNPNLNTYSYNITVSGLKIQLSSRSDTAMLILVLLSMVMLTRRIKEEKIDEIENN